MEVSAQDATVQQPACHKFTSPRPTALNTHAACCRSQQQNCNTELGQETAQRNSGQPPCIRKIHWFFIYMYLLMQGFWIWNGGLKETWKFLQVVTVGPQGTMEMYHAGGSLNHTERASRLRMSHVFLKALSESMWIERHAIVLEQKQVSWHEFP